MFKDAPPRMAQRLFQDVLHYFFFYSFLTNFKYLHLNVVLAILLIKRFILVNFKPELAYGWQ